MKISKFMILLLVSAMLAGTAAWADTFSQKDLSGEYDAAAAAAVRLEGGSASADAEGVSVSGEVVTITREGVYVLSGELENGMILVDTEKESKVTLVLDNVRITAPGTAAIYVKQADKVFITLADGSDNRLEGGGAADAEDGVDGLIYSKDDLTLNGGGALTLVADAGSGIVSKDELKLCGGNYRITAAEHGIAGKDCVCISDGDFVIECGNDAVSSAGDIQILGGSFTAAAGGGSSAVEMKAGDSAGGMRGWHFGLPAAVEEDDGTNAKGIKAGGSITISGGSFALDTADDALHSAGGIHITGGSMTVSTGDDGIHSDLSVVIDDGEIGITYCYEGIEAESITVNGGRIDITAHDDGINAADGSAGSVPGGRFAPGTGSSAVITINGGSIKIVSDGDCLDSNGTITLNGGSLELFCGGNGNTAVDCDGGFSNNGAEISTNDGSDNGGAGFGGGMHGGISAGRDGRQPPESGFYGRGGMSGFNGAQPGGKWK